MTEKEKMQKVMCFLTNVTWRQEERDTGGITWLELYILSVLHGGKMEMDPMAKTISLQSAMKTFKRRVRRIAMHCVLKEDERHFQTCQARSNRMEGLAISNRHAAIRGMPNAQ